MNLIIKYIDHVSILELKKHVNVNFITDIVDVNSPEIVDYCTADTIVRGELAQSYDVKDGKLVIDYEKAKSIIRDRFREARKPILEKLDVEYMRAIETGNSDKITEIVSKKQALRDVTAIDLPDSLEELLTVWPDILNI